MTRPFRGAILLSLLVSLGAPVRSLAWGLAGHGIITRNAVERTPEPLRSFLRDSREELVRRSLEPDTELKRRDGDHEKVRHYLDLERLSKPPFTDIPSDPAAARARYGAKRLHRAGTVPWTVESLHRPLVEAMRSGNARETLRLAGYLSHYVADAHSPLHSTLNYDGRLTGNDGIHELYETRMVARRAKFFRDPGPGGPVTPRVERDYAARVLDVLRASHALCPALFAADRDARWAAKPGSAAYLDALFMRVGESARGRMRDAAGEIAALWTSAWIEAGRPALRTGAPAPPFSSTRR